MNTSIRGYGRQARTKGFCLSSLKPTAWILVAACLLSTLGSAMGELVLAEKGRSQYRIVIPAQAIPSERYAAEELQRYLEKISAVRMPIVTDAERPNAREILLGDNAHLRKSGNTIDFAGLGADGFTLRTDQSRVIIAGGRPRGTLYGVYALLEEKLGVRWFTPELEVVPQTNRLVLAALK